MTTVSSTGTTPTTTSTTSTSSTTSTASLGTSDISNIDWNAIIEAAVAQRLAPADTIDAKITANQAQVSAYQSLSSLLSTLQTAANALRAPSGTSNTAADAFQSRTAYLTPVGNVDTTNTLSVTTENGAQIGSHSITVSQLATAEKLGSSAQSSATTALGYAGSFSIGTADGSSASIAVTATMSLADIVDAVNNQSSTTGVQASILQVTSSSYEMILSTTSTGQTITASAGSGDDVLQKLGVTDGTGAFADQLQAAQSAIMTVDGVQVTRATNDISDVVSGVTFHLYGATPSGTSITADVGTDLSTVETAVQSLVTAYNAVRAFAYGQQSVTQSDGTNSALFGDGLLRNISSTLQDTLSSEVDGYSMADLGLSFDTTNNLTLDTSTLDNAILNNLDAVQSLLNFQMTSSSSDLKLLDRGTGAPASFTLDVSVDADGNLSGASVGGDSSLFTIRGATIVGNAGTAYAGYSFVYTGNTAQSIDVSVSSGLAEQLYQTAEGATDSTSGTLTQEIQLLQSNDNSLQSQSDQIKSDADAYKTTLTNRYATIQAQIAAAENTKTYLTALLAAQNSSSSA